METEVYRTQTENPFLAITRRRKAQSTEPRADDQILLQLLLCSGHLTAGDIRAIVLNSRVRNKTIELSLADSGAVTTALCSEAHNVFGLYKEGFLTFVQATKRLSHVMPAGEYPVAPSVEEHFEPASQETLNMSIAVQQPETTYKGIRSSAQLPILTSFTKPAARRQEQHDGAETLPTAHVQLMAAMITRGAYVESECLAKQQIKLLEQSQWSFHPQLVDELTTLSGILCAEHKFEESVQVLRKIIDILAVQKTYDGPRVANFLSMLAGIHLKLRQYTEAESVLARSLDIRQLYLPANHPDIRQSLHDFGWLLYKMHREHEGQKLLVQAYPGRAQSKDFAA